MGRQRGRSKKDFKTMLPATEIDISDLTSRQIDVLNLLADGKTNKEIAEALSVVPGTVKSHLSRLMRKFGLHTRTELAVLWAETGGKMVGRGRGARSGYQDTDWAAKSS